MVIRLCVIRPLSVLIPPLTLSTNQPFFLSFFLSPRKVTIDFPSRYSSLIVHGSSYNSRLFAHPDVCRIDRLPASKIAAMLSLPKILACNGDTYCFSSLLKDASNNDDNDSFLNICLFLPTKAFPIFTSVSSSFSPIYISFSSFAPEFSSLPPNQTFPLRSIRSFLYLSFSSILSFLSPIIFPVSLYYLLILSSMHAQHYIQQLRK
ncbi:unnamed protein product [Acanthosepion pharaonis]|uniref:Uncharacterized protein n=1 Tax=Acanthosepion pharaonis TaxID=158019 RepID=A0A812E1S6_ACAPH|nr:unnamed protein product [Sepia pharaonis]